MATLRKQGRTYYLRWTDHEGTRHEKSVGTDKRMAEQAKSKVEEKGGLIRAGLADPHEAVFFTHESRPLSEHLSDWHAYLIGGGATREHANLSRNRVARLIDLGRARRISDLTPSRVQAALKAVRDKGARREEGASLRSVHHYTRAVKGFSRWLVFDKRTREDALDGLKPPNPDPDRRRVRRALTPDEQGRLIRAAESGPTLFGLDGPDRARLYAIALGTGFRANELRTLTPECFDLDGNPPMINVAAAYSKRRHDDMQPIRPELAAALRPWVASLAPGAPVFGNLTMRTAEMIMADLEAAGIAYETSEGTADFHALRHSYVSALARNNVPVKVLQTLARHSTPTLTLGVYAHIGLFDQTAALESLPNLSAPPPGTEAAQMVATGTDGAKISATSCPKFPPNSPQSGDRSGHILSVVGDDGPEDVRQAGRPIPLGDKGFVASGRPASDSVRKYTRQDSNLQPTVPKTVEDADSVSASPLTDSGSNASANTLPQSPPKSTVAYAATDARQAAPPPDLALIIKRWERVPEAVRADIVAMVEAATGETPSGPD